jgi:hypothetical protein
VTDWGPLAEPLHAEVTAGPDDPPWRENAFFPFWDRARSVYGVVHVMTAANATGRRARASLVHRGRYLEVIEPLEPMAFSSPSVSVDLAGTLTATGPGWGFDVVLEPRLDTIDYSAADTMPALVEERPLRHYQRSGTCRGTVTVDGVETAIAGGSLRDRTWGFREETAHWLEYYACFLSFGPEGGEAFDLAMMKFRVAGGPDRMSGFLVGSRSDRVLESRITRTATGSPASLWLRLASRGELTLRVGPPEARVFVPLGEPDGPVAITSYDDFVEVTTDAGETGFGIVEQGILRRLE